MPQSPRPLCVWGGGKLIGQGVSPTGEIESCPVSWGFLLPSLSLIGHLTNSATRLEGPGEAEIESTPCRFLVQRHRFEGGSVNSRRTAKGFARRRN